MRSLAVRLVPEEAFPPYAFVPRKFAHPTRDPSGHSFGESHPKPDPLDPNRWQSCRLYFWGIDLFNFGYYWEAHEAWERLWHASGRHGTIAEFLKGLIALAAAGVKAREGNAAGVGQHAGRAGKIFAAIQATFSKEGDESVQNQKTFMGLDMDSLIRASNLLADSPDCILNVASNPVVVVMPFTLTSDLESREGT